MDFLKVLNILNFFRYFKESKPQEEDSDLDEESIPNFDFDESITVPKPVVKEEEVVEEVTD